MERPPTRIRLAERRDASGVAEIYAPIVRDTAISFELEPPSAEEMGARIAATLERFPWIVEEDPEGLLGYAYASTYRKRAAYRFSAEVSVYVHARARRRGVARRLYAGLFELLRRQGLGLVVAGATLPNEASVRLHEGLGFESAGVVRGVGFKFGRWHDVAFWQYPLQELGSRPPEPTPCSQLAADEVRRALEGAG